MAYVPVPKDLSKVKTKVALGLTMRQIVCFSLAGGFGLPFYLLTKNHIGNDFAAVCMIAITLPFFFFALYQKNGQPAEKVLFNMLCVRYLLPETRPYQTENMYRYLTEQAKEESFEGTEIDLCPAGQDIQKRQGRTKKKTA